MRISEVVALGLLFAASVATSLACGGSDSSGGSTCDCIIGRQVTTGKRVESCTVKVRNDGNGNRLYDYCDCIMTGGAPYNDQPACE
jgi:hypothetical protein